MRTLANLALFQAGWLASVLGAARGFPLLGPAVVAVVLVVHFAFFRARGDLALVAASAVLGLAAEWVLLASGAVSYAGHLGPGGPPPPWIVAMWSNFAITLNHSLSWLKPKLALGAVLGALAGPAAYVAGARLGAITFVSPPAAMGALALLWSGALVLLLWMARKKLAG